MRRYWQYFISVVRHKWFVFLAGMELGVTIPNLILHDWDKFIPAFFIAYAKCFYAPDGSKQYQESPEFAYWWNRHQKINRHHWQSWLLTWDRGVTEALPMNYYDIIEMVADWKGAGRAYGSTDTLAWYMERRGTSKLQLHPFTQEVVDNLLGVELKFNHTGGMVSLSEMNPDEIEKRVNKILSASMHNLD